MPSGVIDLVLYDSVAETNETGRPHTFKIWNSKDKDVCFLRLKLIYSFTFKGSNIFSCWRYGRSYACLVHLIFRNFQRICCFYFGY